MKCILKCIIKLGSIIGIIFAFSKLINYKNQRITEEMTYRSRYRRYYDFMLLWAEAKRREKHLDEALREKGFQQIAIYGTGTIGKLVYNELKDSDIQIICGVDKEAEENEIAFNDIPVYSINKVCGMKEIDAIIVTPIFDYKAIEDELYKGHVKTYVISLEEIVKSYG